ncbi:MAG: hypothetical protein KJP00_15160, partial [Bacteroidia bacterium]|nr:hypothetical protein [Bacteroidia bacterium]
MRLCQKYVIAILVMFMQLSALAQDQQDQDVFVIYFRSPITYDENVYRSDKEAFINQLTPIKALKYKVST